MSDLQQCQDLVAQLGDEYQNEDRTTVIDAAPEKILQISTMGLWAQSTAGEKTINLGLPSLKTWLKNLAANGPGHAEEYQGVRYKFVKQILYSIFELAEISKTKSTDWLVICKGLFSITLPFLLEDVTLSDRGLRAFTTSLLSQEGHITPSKVKRLSIVLESSQGDTYSESPSPNDDQQPSDLTRNDERMKDLTTLAESLHQFTALESFSFTAARKFDPRLGKNPFMPVAAYLYSGPTSQLLKNIPTDRLRDLTIDTCGSAFESRPDDHETEQHMCHIVSKLLLSKIQKIRVRMRSICPDVFDTLDADPAEKPSYPQSIIINLNPFSPKKRVFATQPAELCGVSGPCSHNVLVERMVTSGKWFAESRPETKLIIVSRRSGIEMQATDCRTDEVWDVTGSWLNLA
ncbi:hypothetical protein FQN54_006797 [Arachnomyces sp. PD_36]|nr:hypothetical protein FQN54_006797 [Arachnomyces sp. PD_36]